MAGYFITALAAAGLVTAGVAATGSIRSGDALPVIALSAGAADAGKCSVRVERTGTDGVANVFRADLADGSCVCVVRTGAASKNGAAETTVTDLVRDRQCQNAPALSAEEAASFGPAPSILPVILGAGGAGGVAAGLAPASNG